MYVACRPTFGVSHLPLLDCESCILSQNVTCSREFITTSSTLQKSLQYLPNRFDHTLIYDAVLDS